MIRRFVVAAVVLPLAASCVSAPPADPCASANREVNLFVLLDNTASGTYDACLDDLRDELARIGLRTRALEGEAARLEAEAAGLKGERAEAAKRLASLNLRQADALARIEAARDARAVDREALRQVLAREKELARELEVLNRAGGISDTEADRLKSEQDGLMERIEVLLGEG